MGEETARLRDEIDRTRENLTRDVDLLAEKTSPSRIVQRRVHRTRRGLSGLRDRVMGSVAPGETVARARDQVSDQVSQAGERVSQARDQVSEQVSQAGERMQQTAQGAVSGVREQTEGNPLAAGLVAFGVGWLVSSLMPATQAETQAAQRGVEAAKEHAGPVVEQAKQAAQEIGQDLQGPAQQAAEQVKERTQDAASTVREEARSATSS